MLNYGISYYYYYYYIFCTSCVSKTTCLRVLLICKLLEAQLEALFHTTTQAPPASATFCEAWHLDRLPGGVRGGDTTWTGPESPIQHAHWQEAGMGACPTACLTPVPNQTSIVTPVSYLGDKNVTHLFRVLSCHLKHEVVMSSALQKLKMILEK